MRNDLKQVIQTANQVDSRESFIVFLKALEAFSSTPPEQYASYNSTLPMVSQALAAWLNDAHDHMLNDLPQNPWAFAAHLLEIGVTYE